MNERICNRPKQLIAELVDNSLYYSAVHDVKYHYKSDKQIPDKLLPGRAILNLSEYKRTILKELKSDDIQNIRWMV